jgi:hypothetical protein
MGAIADRVSPGAVAQDLATNTLGVTTIVGTASLDVAPGLRGYIVVSDLTGFVRRDPNFVRGPQVIIGWGDHTTGQFQVDLPIVPHGTVNDVGHGQGGNGVQIYSVDSYYDAVLDPRPGPWEFLGWAWATSSILTRHGDHEVTGGQILIWAPDGGQFVPTDFGADGKLFTADDPVGPVPAGWTVLDLGPRPFAQIRTGVVDVSLHRGDLEPLDLSQLPPAEAFDQLVAYMALRYPMPDAKPIDWEGLRAKHRPAFEAAEQSGEQVDVWLAIHHFLLELGVRGYFSTIPWVDHFQAMFVASAGLHVDATDDGKVIVVRSIPDCRANSPASRSAQRSSPGMASPRCRPSRTFRMSFSPRPVRTRCASNSNSWVACQQASRSPLPS